MGKSFDHKISKVGHGDRAYFMLSWKQPCVSNLNKTHTSHRKITTEDAARRFADKWELKWEFD